MDHFFTLILAVHLLAVNVASGAPFWVVFCERGYCRNRALAQKSGLYLSVAAVGALLLGMLLGFVLFALQWSANYSDAVTRLHYKLGWGGAELAFSLLLGGLSIWLWYEGPNHPGATQPKRWLRGGIALLNATNLLYHFPILFLVLRHLVEHPGEGTITPANFRQLMFEPPIPAMAVHVILASLALGGITLMGLSLRLRRESDSEDQKQLADRTAIWAGRAALFPSLLQIPVGLWLLACVGTTSQTKLMGGSLGASLTFLAGIGSALWLLQNLAVVSSGQTDRRTLQMSMGLVTLTVLLMTFAWRLAGG